MEPANRTSTILNTIATILSWIAYGIGIASITANGWLYVGSNYRSGLWRECFNDNCVLTTTVHSWLHAVRAFIIMMVVFTFLANILNIVSQWKLNKKAREGAGSIWLMSAFFGVIGASVYSAIAATPYPDGSYVYGYGYIFAWVSTGLLFIANPLNYYSAKKMPEHYVS